MKNAIVLFHTGWQDYLNVTIDHLLKSIDGIPVYFLGDENNKSLESKGVNHAFYKEYENKYTKCLRNCYIHLSPNGYEYELMCMLRWGYIYEWMRRNKVENAIYIDSDVLLNQVEDKLLSPGKILYYCYDSGHTSSFSLKTMKRFCKFINFHYIKNKKKKALEEEYEELKKTENYGISDMTFFCKYSNKYPSIDTSKGKECVYDHNINCPDGFNFEKGKKKIFYLNDNYYFQDKQTNKYVRANSIHFQGHAKNFMSPISKKRMESTSVNEFDYATQNWRKVEKS